jgi:hypothetical protein
MIVHPAYNENKKGSVIMLTSESIVAIVGIATSLIFNYFPALRVKFAALTTEQRSGIMIGLMILAAFGTWGAGCMGWLDAGVACSVNALPQLGKLIFLALVANVTTYTVSPQLPDVKDAKKSMGTLG